MRVRPALSALAVSAALLISGCASTESPAKVTEEGSAPVVTEASDPTADTDAAEGEDAAASEEESEPAEETAGLGDTVAVAGWDVKVTEVNINAAEPIKQANQFNDPAKGAYVLVTYEATYTGEERTADSFVDLTWTFTGTDNQVIETAYAVTPADNQEWPTVARSGGTVRAQAVFDVPVKVIKGGLLTVEGYDENYDTVYADFTV